MLFDWPEQWLPVVGYEGLYWVSNQGRIRTARRKGSAGGIKKLGLTTERGWSRHWNVSLCRDGVMQTRLVHQLVLEAFVGPCPTGMETLHGPAGSLDNRLSNLRWGTKADNNGPDKLRDGSLARGERQGNAKLTEADVLEIRRRFAAGEMQPTLGEVFGVSSRTISKIVRGRRWHHVAGSDGDVRDQIRPHGEEHGMAILAEADVLAIRRRHALGETQSALGREFGVTVSTVWCIVKRKTWAWLPD